MFVSDKEVPPCANFFSFYHSVTDKTFLTERLEAARAIAVLPLKSPEKKFETLAH
jgi:hypothetical protein